MTAPLLTIAVPTWNRAGYLRQNLDQLAREIATVPAGQVELLVSDNGSDDDTSAVVTEASRWLPGLNYVRKPQNVGWGANFLSCLHLAKGDYVMLLADDDLIVDGGLARLLAALASSPRPGSLTLGTYGFDDDFRAEQPPTAARAPRVFGSADEYLWHTALINTLLSATVLERRLLDLDSVVPDTERNLAHFKYVLRAAMQAPSNLVMREAILASKRDNSSSYRYTQVFVTELWAIYDAVLAEGRYDKLRGRIKRRLLWHYYPRYLASLDGYVPESREEIIGRFDAVFGGIPVYSLLFRPVLRMPARPRYAVFGLWTLCSKLRLGEFHAVRRFFAKRFATLRPRPS